MELYTLHSAGFEAKGFPDGDSFGEALRTQCPELVILDVMLPGESGVELLKRMKASNADCQPTITIRDTGIGIPAEYQGRIFERFFRVDKSRSKASGGTGLGLSIVKHIAQYHGAKLELHSEVGKGTTISVSFPQN